MMTNYKTRTKIRTIKPPKITWCYLHKQFHTHRWHNGVERRKILD